MMRLKSVRQLKTWKKDRYDVNCASKLSGINIILGITGSIAAYKAVSLMREFLKAGACVHPVMTENSTQFVSPLTFSSLAGKEAATDMFPEENVTSAHHIKLAEKADIMVIAPATANIIGKMAAGIADDFLSTLYLAVSCPVIIAPAMNKQMYTHPQVQANIAGLKQKGSIFAGPDSGKLACGEGPGRMASPEEIYQTVVKAVEEGSQLKKTKVLITAGPTLEYIDPIRFISNESSGRMGYALAREARNRGAQVILVSGPTSISPPSGVELYKVMSAEEMYEKTLSFFSECNVTIMSAAVGDFSVENIYTEKIKKESSLTLNLKRNKDILAELGKIRKKQTLVGFCLETGFLLENGRRKRKEKNCSAMVANLNLDEGAGIGSKMGKVTVILENGKEIALPSQSKPLLAKTLWDIFIEEKLLS